MLYGAYLAMSRIRSHNFNGDLVDTVNKADNQKPLKFEKNAVLSCKSTIFHSLLKKKFEDNKEISRIRKSKDRQYNYQKKKDKNTSNDLQNTTKQDRQYNYQKKKDRNTSNDLQNTTKNTKY